MIRIAVCDDDPLFVSKIMKPLLTAALKAVKLNSEVGFFTDGKALIKEFCKQSFDIVILDIDMPVIDGKELARQLRSIDSRFRLAFMSAYKEKAYCIIPYQIDAFIPKEYDISKCFECLVDFLNKFISNTRKATLFNIIVDGYDSVVRLYAEDIFYFDNNKNMIMLHTENEEYILKERVFKKINAAFENEGFFKIYPSIIVNIGKIYEVFDNDIVLVNNLHLPISRRKRKEILVEMANYISAKAVI